MVKRAVNVTLFALCLAYVAVAQKPVVYPTLPPAVESPQEVLLLFSGDTADERILLTLNNNKLAALTTNITVYTASGLSTQLPNISMVASESKLLELSPVLKSAGLGHQELGWLKLNYTGTFLELGAQLTLYPVKGGSGVDSPRSLSADYKSSERHAVFWMPSQSKARLAMTNEAGSSIFVKLRCGLILEDFVIPARTTKMRLIAGTDVALFPSRDGTAVGCDLKSDGAVDALRVAGTVRGDAGYSAPIRFYDTSTSTFQSLTSVGLDTSSQTHVTVHNVTDQAVQLTPVLREATLKTPYSESLGPVTVTAHGSIRVLVAPLMNSFRGRGLALATLTLKTDAPKGAIVGALTQISTKDGLIEDVPLRTSNPAAFARGSYPLRWDEDYTNRVTVTNTATEPLSLGGAITAGGMTYVLTKTTIEPGATYVFDANQIRDDGIPDVNGHVLPRDAPYGKFHWIETTNGKKAGLIGRTSLASVKDQRRSSFSCGSTCDQTFYGHPYFGPGIITTIRAGDIQVSAITDYTETRFARYSSPLVFPPSYVYVAAPSIANLEDDPNITTNIVLRGNVSGNTEMDYIETNEYFIYDPGDQVCVENDNNVDQRGTTTVADNTPIITGIDPADWAAGSTQRVAFTGQYFGSNTPALGFSPQGGITYLLVSHSDSEIIADVTVGNDIPDEDVSVSVTSAGYGGNGFISGGGTTSPVSRSVYAVVHAPLNAPEVTVVAWVNGQAPDLLNLPTGANATLQGNLAPRGATCALQVGQWAVFKSPSNLYSQEDRDYANAFLLANSANSEPPPTITPADIKSAQDFRLFSDWGNSKSSYKVGATPDPCGVIPLIVTRVVASGENSSNMGFTNTSTSGKVYRVVEGPIGKLGQSGGMTINGRTAPWIYTVIAFDASGNATTTDHATFPTYSVYVNNHRVAVYGQSTVKAFVYGYDQSNENNWSPVP